MQTNSLVFFYGTMAAGKSTLAIQSAFNLKQAGFRVLFLTQNDRSGDRATSRIGLEHEAIMIDSESNLFSLAVDAEVNAVVVDEAQFCTPEQVEQLMNLTAYRLADVFAFGLRADFQSKLFPGSKRLFELANRCVELQLETFCWCGAHANQNARTRNGHIVREGPQIMVGDVDDDKIGYELLCNQHYFSGRTRAHKGTPITMTVR